MRRMMNELLLPLREDLVAGRDLGSLKSPCQSLHQTVQKFWRRFLAGTAAREIQPEIVELNFAQTEFEIG